MPAPTANTLNAILQALEPLRGRRVVDVGCGRGELLSELAVRGAKVAGVDPDKEALAEAARLVPGAYLQQGAAESLPFGDRTAHAIVLLNSLHHVAVERMPHALAEAARVVGPGGTILVVEPLAEGGFFEAMRPIEDESRQRLAAQNIVAKAIEARMLIEVSRLAFERVEAFADVAAFIERVVAIDPARRERMIGQLEKVGARFLKIAEPDPRGFVLRQPLRFQHLKVPG